MRHDAYLYASSGWCQAQADLNQSINHDSIETIRILFAFSNFPKYVINGSFFRARILAQETQRSSFLAELIWIFSKKNKKLSLISQLFWTSVIGWNQLFILVFKVSNFVVVAFISLINISIPRLEKKVRSQSARSSARFSFELKVQNFNFYRMTGEFNKQGTWHNFDWASALLHYLMCQSKNYHQLSWPLFALLGNALPKMSSWYAYRQKKAITWKRGGAFIKCIQPQS